MESAFSQSTAITAATTTNNNNRRSRGKTGSRTLRPLKFHPPPRPFDPAHFIHFRPIEGPLPTLPPSALGIRSVTLMTVRLLEMFAQCNPAFHYDRSLNPRRVLTKPHRPTYNNGWDNERHDYILYVNDVLGNEEEGRRYVILDLLGQGTFGQVVKCQNLKTRELVAIKVIKNQTAFFNQSMMEVTVLELLNQRYDREDRRHIVRLRDTFVFRGHLCIVVELLSLNLYELIKQNQYRGFSLTLCRLFLSQILDALKVLKEARIIHCDLKPENILLRNLESPSVKVIDFGSACHEHQTLYTYIQSRFYRSPEVLLGLPYSASIDMWSLGCIAAELFLGLPIFPGASNYDQINRIVATLGVPPAHMLEVGKEASTYFERTLRSLSTTSTASTSSWQLKSREKYSLDTGRAEAPPKQYFSSTRLDEIILNYPIRPRDMSPRDREAELAHRKCFLDFIRGLLTINPIERWSPWQAVLHPFITGKTWTGPFTPPTIISSTTNVPIPTANGGGVVSAVPVQAGNRLTTGGGLKIGPRPRANTLSSLSLQEVPPQLQRLTNVSKEKGGGGIAPTERSDTIPESIMEVVSTGASLPPIESYLGARMGLAGAGSGGTSGMTSLSSSYKETTTGTIIPSTLKKSETSLNTNKAMTAASNAIHAPSSTANTTAGAATTTTADRMSTYLSNRRVSQPVTALSRIRVAAGGDGASGAMDGSNAMGIIPNSVPSMVWYGSSEEITSNSKGSEMIAKCSSETTSSKPSGSAFQQRSLASQHGVKGDHGMVSMGMMAAPNVGRGIRRGSFDHTNTTMNANNNIPTTTTTTTTTTSTSWGRRKSTCAADSPRRSNLSNSFVSGEMFPLTLDSPVDSNSCSNTGKRGSNSSSIGSSSMEPLDEGDEDDRTGDENESMPSSNSSRSGSRSSTSLSSSHMQLDS